MAQVRHAAQHQVTEWAYTSGQAYDDPFNQLELDVVFTGPGGEIRVPAFWAGGNEWRVRFAPPRPGTYRFETVCTDTANADLHGAEGTLEASACAGENPLLARGPLRVSDDHRHFQHADGTPFFWLGDTWWMGLSRRLRWPEDFQRLAADRAAKGFTVIQIVAGLYPDMPAFDPRGANEAGLPWQGDYARINPGYFDQADLRVQWLVRSGLVPCIVGCWAYFLPWMGTAKMKQHWRYLLARWGGYPVVWCLAGEAAMPYYDLTHGPQADEEKARQARTEQLAGWTELGRYLRHIDPYHRPVTIHPSSRARDEVHDDSVLDFDMLQTGHGGRDSIPNTIRQVVAEHRRRPTMPVLVGETCYEGIVHGNDEEIQRLAFWGCMLSGAGGHTYGANGIWQVNTRTEPFGPSPHGGTWGNQPWEDACRLPGSKQLGIGKRLLERYRWWQFEPHPEWVEPSAGEDNYFCAYAAGIPGRVRVMYLWQGTLPWGRPVSVRGLEAGVRYRAFFFDPRSGAEHDLGRVRPEAGGAWGVPVAPEMRDWVLVLERHDPR